MSDPADPTEAAGARQAPPARDAATPGDATPPADGPTRAGVTTPADADGATPAARATTLAVVGASLVAGVARAGAGETWRAVAPATGQETGPAFRPAGPGDVEAAVEAAVDAHAAEPLSPRAGAAVLRAAATIAEAHGDLLVATAGEETGLAEARLRGELARTTGQLRFLAEVAEQGERLDATIDTARPDARPPQPDMRKVGLPLGPVAVFGASNFPLAFGVLGGDTAAALAAGCPVVVKGHPAHPATSELGGRVLAAAVGQAGLHPGWTSLLQGAAEVGRALATAPGVRAVAFTGSLGGGRALFDAAATRPDPIPVYAEMGALNPVVVTAAAVTARGEAIAAALVGAVTGSAGQLCTKPGVVLGPPAALDALAPTLAAAVAGATGPLLAPGMRSGLDAQLADTVSHPGVVLVGGVEPGPAGEGLGFRGAVLRCDLATFAATPALQEEHFGPVCVLVDCPEDELAGAVTHVEGSLTGTLHAEPEDDELARPVLDALARRCGRVVVGAMPTGLRVGRATHHGGPWPATTAPLTTSVGSAAVDRFLRPVAFQDVPDRLLPPALADANPWGIVRRVDGILTRDPVRR